MTTIEAQYGKANMDLHQVESNISSLKTQISGKKAEITGSLDTL